MTRAWRGTEQMYSHSVATAGVRGMTCLQDSSVSRSNMNSIDLDPGHWSDPKYGVWQRGQQRPPSWVNAASSCDGVREQGVSLQTLSAPLPLCPSQYSSLMPSPNHKLINTGGTYGHGNIIVCKSPRYISEGSFCLGHMPWWQPKRDVWGDVIFPFFYSGQGETVLQSTH